MVSAAADRAAPEVSEDMVSKAGRTARQAAFQEKADNRRIRVHRRTDRVRLLAASEEVPADPAAGTDLHAAANIPTCMPH